MITRKSPKLKLELKICLQSASLPFYIFVWTGSTFEALTGFVARRGARRHLLKPRFKMRDLTGFCTRKQQNNLHFIDLDTHLTSNTDGIVSQSTGVGLTHDGVGLGPGWGAGLQPVVLFGLQMVRCQTIAEGCCWGDALNVLYFIR